MVFGRSSYQVVLFLLLAGCNPSPLEFKDKKNQKAELPVRFAEVQEKVFMKSCQECHARRKQFTFESYALVVQMAAEIENRVLVMQDMPPTFPLDSGQTQTLAAWLSQGALE